MTAEEWLISADRVRRMERDLFLKPPTIESIRAFLLRRGWVPVSADVMVFEGLRIDLSIEMSRLLAELRRSLKV